MKTFPVAGLVVLSMGAATSATADNGRYLKTKEVFEEAPGLRVESALAVVTPHSDGKYEFYGTCFEPDGETWSSYVLIDLLARQSTDQGVGDFFAEEELSAVKINGRRSEFDQERKIYVRLETSVFKAVDRNGDKYLLEELRSPDGSHYCVYALE